MDDMLIPDHPFYPPEIQLLGYLANEWDVPRLLAGFAAVNAGVLGLTYLTAKFRNPNLPTADMLCVIWFVFSTSWASTFET